ncbi:MAG: site-specific tyrosine recombinase XerD [Leptospiraceae bacterium]|nr:site-specific tyrosine recombinase XerD [Leptospiraceae bacterium]
MLLLPAHLHRQVTKKPTGPEAVTTKEAIIQEFQDYLLVEKGLSENSIFSYTYDLKKFQKFVHTKNRNLLDASSDDISEFLQDQKSRQISGRSMARAVAALRQFYRYLKDEERVQLNPAVDVQTPEVDRTLPEYLTIAEIDEFFNVINENDIFELRDKAIFELLYSSGLRISEACLLKSADIDFENMFLTIRGKNNRERLVPFGEHALELLQRYQNNSRSDLLKERFSEYFFVSKKGDCLNRKSVWRLLKKYLSRTGIKKTVTPHTFRHSFATHLIENNADLRSVQELLGHIDISTTQVYTHMVSRTLKEVHKKYHPRG